MQLLLNLTLPLKYLDLLKVFLTDLELNRAIAIICNSRFQFKLGAFVPNKYLQMRRAYEKFKRQIVGVAEELKKTQY